MRMKGTWKEKWTELKTTVDRRNKRKNQDVISTGQRKGKASTFSRCIYKKCHLWLKASISPKKVAAVTCTSMQEQVVEKRGWK